MSHDDFATEPVRGLPEALPEGEEILWQGAPDIWALARDALMIRWVAGYFALLAAWRGAVASAGGAAEAVAAVLWMAALGLVACGLLYLIAVVQAKATVYTITNRRVAMRIGAALTLTLNLPFNRIERADIRRAKDGAGDIAMTLTGANRISYLVAWPHVRPWRMGRTQPALRCVAGVDGVARIFAEAARKRVDEPKIGRAPAGAPAPAAMAAE